LSNVDFPTLDRPAIATSDKCLLDLGKLSSCKLAVDPIILTGNRLICDSLLVFSSSNVVVVVEVVVFENPENGGGGNHNDDDDD